MSVAVITRDDARESGLRRYFTGVPCVRGHVAERRVSNMNCTECAGEDYKNNYAECNDRAARSYLNNRDKALAQRRARYLRKTEIEKRQMAVYRSKNKAKIAAIDSAYRARNSDALKAKRASYRAKNKETIRLKKAHESIVNVAAIRDRSRKWYLKNSTIAKSRAARRRVILQDRGSYSAADVREILVQQKHRCAYCKVGVRHLNYHIDHIQPLARGGANTRRNIQILCQPCNNRKHAKDPIVFARQLGMLV